MSVEASLAELRGRLEIEPAMRRIRAFDVADRLLPLALAVLAQPLPSHDLDWGKERYGCTGRFEFDIIFERASGIPFETFAKHARIDQALRFIALSDAPIDQIVGPPERPVYNRLLFVSDEAAQRHYRRYHAPSPCSTTSSGSFSASTS